MTDQPQDALRFPFETMPEFGEITEVRPGILWTRVPLPYRLDHVNIYLIRDGEGWAVIDTGIQTDAARQTWEHILAGPLKGARITRVIVTHYHPDHIGLAGWLCDRFDAPLLTSFSTFMGCKVISQGASESMTRYNFDFYLSHGMTEQAAGVVAIQGNEYLRRVGSLPKSFLRLLMPDTLEIGGRAFRVITGDGHAAEQVMLYCQDEGLLFAADQVIERISPNISVFADEPNGDPLGHFLRALRFLRAEIPDDVLVLPGHRRIFHGLHQRCAELEAHHQERCQRVLDACAGGPKSIADLVPVLFTRDLDPHQMSFAFTETLAHVNRLVRRGEITADVRDGRIFHVLSGAAE
ncbi:Hydroxyacylglutathione hydrolase (plasmid) [Sulfitobacter sp. THAF37]|uniref:MBL fold metallo-hydrolase n=1 Tax=Sulfitobacter sp. THAF37 TaxID=2587855 RepID=UPI001267C66C|nr:MBL fold metallo-hydrolase [Sulfitobacter sp. THAF37]QFT60797.1 Hydroxyacylglutathione hydrolase [Sulfitobacter sp. THAF37]